MTSQPKNPVNLSKRASANRKKEDTFSQNLNSLQKRLLNSKRLHSSVISDNDQPTKDSKPEKTTSDNNSGSFETIQKKIKVSSHESSSRKVSFDNESDHSTAYDVGSEGTPTIEIGECLSSPPLSSRPSKMIPLIKLDDDIPLLDQSSIPSSSASKENPILIADDEPLSTCPVNEDVVQEKVKLKCEFRHKLKTPVNESEEEKCPKCDALLRKCQFYATENGGVCLNEKYGNMINFMCFKGHNWSVRYRNFSLDWCPDCAEEKKEEFRKKCEEERKKREKIEEESQKKLFEEARKKAMSSPHQGGPIGEEDLAYFRQIDLEAENMAKKKTTEFMSQQGISKDITFQQTFQVNKVLATPEECLQKYMQSLGTETVKSEFRRIAKIIHPDKNKHPEAGVAFQKIHKVYEAVVGRFEGR